MSINLEQAKRLKVAGFPVDMDGHRSGKLYCITTEKDLMEWLRDNVEGFAVEWDNNFLGVCMWRVDTTPKNTHLFHSICHSDLTEALVQAVEAVLEGREGK